MADAKDLKSLLPSPQALSGKDTYGHADPPHVPQHVHAGPEMAIPDPDLARVAAAWPDLPAAIKAAVLALLDAATHDAPR
jgi:hypothetical protein